MVFYEKQRGNFGEQLAIKYLLKHSYQIITCHYQKKIGEVDIIALDPQKTLVFFEVKTRESEKYGSPQEAITPQKLKKLIKVSLWFLKEKRIKNQKFRFDVIAIKLNQENKTAQVKHFKNITQS